MAAAGLAPSEAHPIPAQAKAPSAELHPILQGLQTPPADWVALAEHSQQAQQLATTEPAINWAGMSQKLDALTQARHGKGMTLGVCVVSLPDGQTRFDFRADQPLIPASNLKLVSTWAALKLLGPAFQYETVLALRGDDLVILGAGDPALGDRRLCEEAGVDVTWVFSRWTEALRKLNVATVKDVIVDDAVFEPPAPHPNWPKDQLLRWYCAEVGGLTFNAACVEFRSVLDAGKPKSLITPLVDAPFLTVREQLKLGKEDVLGAHRPLASNAFTVHGTVKRGLSSPIEVAVRDPGVFFAQALASHLRRHEVRVTGEVRRQRVREADGRVPEGLRPVAIFRTPIADALRRANQQSQNLFAECLFKSVSAYAPDGKPRWSPNGPTPGATPRPGAIRLPAPGVGSWANSSQVTLGLLTQLGVKAGQATLDDGCGLSRQNRVSARAMTVVLADAYSPPLREAYLASLPTGGLAGSTLHRRLKDGPIAGNVLAKTGYISGVSCLSGYVRSADGKRWAAFSVLCNNVTGDARAVQDQAARAVFDALQSGK